VLDDAGYARLFATLARMETERRLRPAVADAVRIIALTGARRGEVLGLRWRHVDMQGGCIVLPKGAHKTGHKTGKPRIISLPAAAQAIVARQPEGDPNDYVFRTRNNGPVTLAEPWRRIRAEAGLPANIGLHGLRHSLGTAFAVAGAQAPEIMTLLGHRSITPSHKYIHFANAARAAVAERAAAPALAALAAVAGAPKAEVVALPKTARKRRQ
jgi:integrase